MTTFKVGDRVMTRVPVAGKWVDIREGIVTRIIDSTCIEVDIGSLHGCEPWKMIETRYNLRLIEDE